MIITKQLETMTNLKEIQTEIERLEVQLDSLRNKERKTISKIADIKNEIILTNETTREEFKAGDLLVLETELKELI